MQQCENDNSVLFKLYNRARTECVLVFESKLLILPNSTFIRMLINDKSNIATKISFSDIDGVTVTDSDIGPTVLILKKNGEQRKMAFKNSSRGVVKEICEYINSKI